jgi:hypothetical protein
MSCWCGRQVFRACCLALRVHVELILKINKTVIVASSWCSIFTDLWRKLLISNNVSHQSSDGWRVRVFTSKSYFKQHSVLHFRCTNGGNMLKFCEGWDLILFPEGAWLCVSLWLFLDPAPVSSKLPSAEVKLNHLLQPYKKRLHIKKYKKPFVAHGVYANGGNCRTNFPQYCNVLYLGVSRFLFSYMIYIY